MQDAASEQSTRTPAQLLEETFKAWNEREFDHLAELFAQDVIYDSTEIGDAVIVGRAKLRAYFDQVVAITDVLFEVETIVENEGRVASVIGLRGRGEQSGAPMIGRLAQVARVTDGRVAHARWFVEPAAAFAEVGLNA